MEQNRAISVIAGFLTKMKTFTQLCRVSIFFLFILMVGCKESSFELSGESRLPKWFEIPAEMTRNEFRVTMDYYIGPSGRKAVFKLRDRSNRILQKVTGRQQGLHPIKLKGDSEGFPRGRPLYEIITVDGKTEIIEHRVRGPIFHITDDPSVWKELGVE